MFLLKLQNALASFALTSSFDFFISYSRKDRAYAEALAVSLTKLDLYCFLDQWGTEPGSSLPQQTENALLKSRFFILIGTNRGYLSSLVEREFNAFATAGKPIILIDLGGATKPEWLQHYGFARLSDPLAHGNNLPSADIVNTLGRTPKQHWLTKISGALRESLPFKRDKSGIFISYRTVDTAGFALWIYEKLKSKFWFRPIFLDIASINAGQDWEMEIKHGLKRSGVLTALIGEAWLSLKDEHGELLLYKSDDYVRYEIATALGDGLKVIPVLFDNAKMPRLRDLPPDLYKLRRKQPVVIKSRAALDDVKVLIRAIKRSLKER